MAAKPSKLDRSRTDAHVWLTVGDAARALKVDRHLIYWLVGQGRLTCEYTLSGRYLFRKADVMALEQARAEARLLRRRRPALGRPAVQRALPLEVVSHVRPESWRFANFPRARMLRAEWRSKRDREVGQMSNKPLEIPKGSGRVA